MSSGVLESRIADVLAAIDLEEPIDTDEVLRTASMGRPCGDRILALPLTEALTGVGEDGRRLLVRPSPDAGEKPCKFLCLATGPGLPVNAERNPITNDSDLVYASMPCEPGDVFIASPFVGNAFEDRYRLVKASDVLMILNP